MDRIFLLPLRQTTALWRAEDALVADDATVVNLFRLRILWRVAVVFNGLFLMVFLWRLLTGSLSPTVLHWTIQMAWVHAFIVSVALVFGWLVHRAGQVRHARVAGSPR